MLIIERHGLQKFSHWLGTLSGRLSVVALVAVLILAWQAPTLTRAAKVWRVKRLIAQSEAAHQSGDEAGEARLLQEAFNLLPAHTLTLRARAHYHELRGEATALVAYRQLLSNADATMDDAIRACRLAALRGSPETCEKILELAARIEGTSEHPALLALRARAVASTNSWKDALTLSEKAVEQSGSGAPEKLLLATTLLRAADGAAEAERFPMAERAVALLAELAMNSDETAVEALGALIGLARQSVAEKLFAGRDVNVWIDAAGRHPKASPKMRVQAWSLQLVGKREPADTFFPAFLERWREAPLPERLEAARWLNQSGHPRLCLGLTFAEKDASMDWFLVHLDALAALAQWTALLEHLDAGNGQAATMPGALRTLFRLIARAALREPVDVGASWREIQSELQGGPVPTQLFIAQYAEKTGEFKQAVIAYQRILELSTTSALSHNLSRDAKFACYTGLLRCLPVAVPLAELLPIVEALATEFPELEEARNDAAYLRALAGRVADEDRAEVARLLARTPTEPKYRATAAFIELQSGNAAGAHKLYEGVEIDWRSALDRVKAVRVAVLAAAGRAEEARAMRTKIRESNLRPEELALLP